MSTGKNELTDISGVGPAKAKALSSAGFKNPKLVARASVDQLVSRAGLRTSDAAKIHASATEIVGPETSHLEPDTAPRHHGSSKERSSIMSGGISSKTGKGSEMKRKAEFRTRWEAGENASSHEEYKWVREFLR